MIRYSLRGSDERRRAVLASARALHLRRLLRVERRAPRVAAALLEDAELAATCLGWHPAVLRPNRPHLYTELCSVLVSLAYRLGEDLRCATQDGTILIYNERLVRRQLFAEG